MPSAVVTVTSTVPAVPAGLTAVIWLPELTVKLVAGTPPKATALVPFRLRGVIRYGRTAGHGTEGRATGRTAGRLVGSEREIDDRPKFVRGVRKAGAAAKTARRNQRSGRRRDGGGCAQIVTRPVTHVCPAGTVIE